MMENREERNEEKLEVTAVERKSRISVRRLAKKGLTLGLCAILVGGLAAGTFGGTNTKQATVQAATTDGVTLLKTKDSSDDADTASDEEKVKGWLDVSDIVEAAMPSVVSITMKSIQEVEDYYGYYGFYGFGPSDGYSQEVEGSGSGIIVGKNDDQLLIVTNYHVVEDATSLTVTFADGESYEAKVKGFDDPRDLAVVSVEFKDLSDDTLDAIDIAAIGSSDDLKVGEQVIAIGNALGYGQSVTTGIVSAKNRQLDEQDEDVNLIQTDAAINPGNSGGALLNMNGEVVGINSAKMAATTVEGMGYAIAISDVSDILEELMNEVPREELEDHGVLHIAGTTVSTEAQMFGLPKGVSVQEVTEGGAADNAGIKVNNIITKFDGKNISSIERLVELLKGYAPGEEVEVVIAVPDGGEYKEKTVTVTLDEQDASTKEAKKDSGEEEKKDAPDREEAPDREDAPEDLPDDEDDFFGKWGEGFQFGKPAWN